jgi:uncharacterized damage-inducible protein DinB
MIIDNQMLWRQYAKSFDSLEKALRDCPPELWEARLWEDQPDQWVAAGFSSFWYLGYHTLFWLDLYLTGEEEGFMPPEPFDLVEMVENETLPRTYTRQELLTYLEDCRRKYRENLAALSQEQAYRLCTFPWGQVYYGELLIYTLRHVEEHTAQLHMFLGQRARKTA